MIFCKYTRIGSAAFVPHLDSLRAVGMAIRRAGLNVEFSDGFNPHMQLFFNQPLPIGTQSRCEYFCAHSNDDAQTFKQKLNCSLPEGVEILKCSTVASDPNIANLMFSASYEIEFENAIKSSDVDTILKKENFDISFSAKGENKTKDVRALIFELIANGNMLNCRLGCGNVNLRADRLGANLCSVWGNKIKSVTKTVLFDKNGTDIDAIFFKD